MLFAKRRFIRTSPLNCSDLMAKKPFFFKLTKKKSLLARIRAFFSNKYLWMGLGGLLAVIAIMIYVFNSMLMPRYTRADTSFVMPDVQGLLHQEAIDSLLTLGIETIVWDSIQSLGVDNGLILDQNPIPNARIKPGRTAYLRRAHHNRDAVKIPKVSEVGLDEARNILRNAGFVWTEEADENAAACVKDIVTEQKPAPGMEALEGDTLMIKYSTDPGRLVVVPDVVGFSPEQALSVLEVSEFAAKPDSTITQVTGQTPIAGTRHRAGCTVVFW